ncbi:MAG: hypothetical protein J6Y37_18500 [Paludibacteraceae bacterium]|nr:hypothetical protein [Paludibacteraceae bacterium]
MNIYVITGESRLYKAEEGPIVNSGVLAVFTEKNIAIAYVRKHYDYRQVKYVVQKLDIHEESNGYVYATSIRKHIDDVSNMTEVSVIKLQTMESDETGNNDPNIDIMKIF